MNGNILLSKIVAIPTDSTWSQAYSTLNLYIVLSIKSEIPGKSMARAGKDLFERIQREYFSLDQKTLKNVKKSVEDAVVGIEDKKSISVVLATIHEDILYIVIAGGGAVVLKRQDKIGTIAEETEGEISAFSGNLETDDIIILETADFGTKIPISKLSSLINSSDVSEISETIAPVIHEEPAGTEASIILQYKDIAPVAATSENTETVEEESTEPAEEIEEVKINKPKVEEEEIDDAGSFTAENEEIDEEPKKDKIKTSGGGFKLFRIRNLIIVVIIVLAIGLVGSVFYEQTIKETKARQDTLTQILAPEQKKFDEANALAALNKGLALDEFNQIKQDLSGSQDKIKAGTPERKKYDEFVGKVEEKIGELGNGSTLAGEKTVYDKQSDFVQFKNKQLVVVTKDGAVSLLDSSGASTKDFDTKNSGVTSVAENDDGIYVLGGSGITLSTKAGATKAAIKDASDVLSIDTFGANLYGLTKTGVNKYAGGTGTSSDYLKDAKLTDATSLSIDSSIWVIDNGKIRKFTKGAEETFTVSGLSKDLSANSQIFTDTDYSNVYVLDPGATRIVSISKDGTVKNQYVSKDLGNTTSFAVDEPGKKIYVIINNKLSSFDL